MTMYTCNNCDEDYEDNEISQFEDEDGAFYFCKYCLRTMVNEAIAKDLQDQ